MKSSCKKLYKKYLPYLIILIFALCIVWPQIHNQTFISGADYYFHMSRTYEAAMQIKTGHFSYFLSLFSWNHNARIINAVYGPFWGYLSGIILLIVRSWVRWEICISLITLLLAGSTMYYLGRYWHVNNIVNILVSILYMLSQPICDFLFNQTFTGFGSTLVPLVVLLSSESLVKKDINPIKLALILTLILEIHLMTFVLSMCLLIPCLLLSLIYTHQRLRFIYHVSLGFLLTMALSFNLWGSIIEIFSSNYRHLLPTAPFLGKASYSTIMNTYPKTSLLQTPSLIGMFGAMIIIITCALWIISFRKLNGPINVFMIIGLVMIWASSKWFPWSLAMHYMSLFTNILQFPKRFLPIGLVLLYLSLGVILSRYISHDHQSGLILGVSLLLLFLIGGCWRTNYDNLHYDFTKINHPCVISNQPSVIDWVGSMCWQGKKNFPQLRNSLRDNHPGEFLSLVGHPVPDYLPTKITYHSDKYKSLNPSVRYHRIFNHHSHYDWSVPRSNQENITIKSHNDNIQRVPFIKYAHTKVILNHHMINPEIDDVGAMDLPLRKGWNQFSIQYQPSHWFEIGILISLLVWIALLGYLIKSVKSNR